MIHTKVSYLSKKQTLCETLIGEFIHSGYLKHTKNWLVKKHSFYLSLSLSLFKFKPHVYIIVAHY